jgi:hypothetical protein
MLSRSRTSNDESELGVADGVGVGVGDSVPLDPDGEGDADADGETGILGGGVDPVADADADGEGEGVEWAGRDDQLTPIAWSAAPTGSMYTAAVPPVPLTRRTVTTSVMLCRD